MRFQAVWKFVRLQFNTVYQKALSVMPPKNSECRANCGACCIAPSINSPLPGMPNGKPAGVPCVNLDDNMRCKIFGQPERPRFCASLQPCRSMCGSCRQEAMDYLAWLETATAPE